MLILSVNTIHPFAGLCRRNRISKTFKEKNEELDKGSFCRLGTTSKYGNGSKICFAFIIPKLSRTSRTKKFVLLQFT
jgi:hypothetical protein